MSFLGMGIAIPFIADPSFWIVTLLGEDYAPAGNALAILVLYGHFTNLLTIHSLIT